MDDYLPLLVALVALLLGIAGGKAHERYKLKDGRLIDRRRMRESPHYLQALNFLVAGQLDLAIDGLQQAMQLQPDSLEMRMMLGNLLREKGQVGRAIQEHQALLQRPKLRRLEHANVLLCLGLDYRRGGFVDRALDAFTEVLRLDPDNQYALLNLEKLHAEQHQWERAYEMRQRLTSLGPEEGRRRGRAILAFLENERGLEAMRASNSAEASSRFAAAVDTDPTALPAYLNLGDIKRSQGQTAAAVEAWERLVQVSPDRAYLTFDRLEQAYSDLGTPDRFVDLCRRLVEGNAQDWRARLAMGRHRSAAGRHAEAIEPLFEALINNPHGLAIHEAIWRTLSALDLPRALVNRYIDVTRDAVFYLDPHVCIRCRYRSTELLWQCPQCHEWNTFVEERISPAKDETTPAELMH
ncbi:MAG TPA: tetratricopeptide repeat protein [Vicinamibacterales bacterium]|nr:tetratricopeptide repeat protein [Vicinamibacterales bacterium]